MKAHEIDYAVLGDDIQAVEIELDPGETVIAEAGAMNYMEEGITFESKMGDGTDANAGMMNKLFGAGKRLMAGESMMITHFTNSGVGKQKVCFAAPYPGKIIPLNLAELGGTVLCQRDGFLCAAFGTKLDIAFTQKMGAGFFGGEGFILQKLSGDGLCFVHACGTIIKRELRGETLRVDTGCLVAFTPGIDYSIQRAGNLKSMIFGGEGLFLATLRGTGTVWLQSLPFSRLANRIIENAPVRGGSSAEQSGGVLGAIGNMFET
ncbi:MAG: TIGR00266 family protein [Candidatus Obscuribacterales bacterium]